MNTQTTQSTLKAAINNVANLDTASTRRVNNFQPNFSLETYQCGGCG